MCVCMCVRLCAPNNFRLIQIIKIKDEIAGHSYLKVEMKSDENFHFRETISPLFVLVCDVYDIETHEGVGNGKEKKIYIFVLFFFQIHFRWKRKISVHTFPSTSFECEWFLEIKSEAKIN